MRDTFKISPIPLSSLVEVSQASISLGVQHEQQGGTVRVMAHHPHGHPQLPLHLWDCIRETASQQAGKPVAPPVAEYRFQLVVGDYLSLQGFNFLVLGDRPTHQLHDFLPVAMHKYKTSQEWVVLAE